MDTTIKKTLCLFTIIFIAFASLVSYNGFVEKAYLASLATSYTYTCTITTDSTLSNVTFFIPVPADPSGNSPVVARFSDQGITGIPGNWTATLYDTGKATLVRITTPAIIPLEKTGSDKRFTITLSSEGLSDNAIDTRDPVNHSALFRPVRDLRQVSCHPGSSGKNGTPQCYHYLTSLYADYQALPGASVNITSVINGKNTWKIFDPGFNEYSTGVTIVLSGPQHGWNFMEGELKSGSGITEIPTFPAKTIG